jgi:hypothetical protein
VQIKKQQQKIEMILDSKKIPYDKRDVAASEEDKKKMRELSGNQTALPPQLVNGEQYCGVSRLFSGRGRGLMNCEINWKAEVQTSAHITILYAG